MRTCRRCGALAGTEGDDDLPLGWSVSSTDRGGEALCPDCTRLHVRSIEAKLPEEWW